MRAQYWLQFRNITFYVFEISLYVQQACIYKKKIIFSNIITIKNNCFLFEYTLK